MSPTRAALVLEDGAVFLGEAFGAAGSARGEVVFNTGMTGYQEVLTDPSYAGQMVVMTYPLVGNYGINLDDSESWKPHVRGFIVREVCDEPSHWRSVQSLNDYLKANRILGLSGVDTRALTRHLRRHGTLRGVLTTDIPQERAGHGPDNAALPPDVPDAPALPPEMVARLAEEARQVRLDGIVAEVTTPRPYHFGLPLPVAAEPPFRVAVLDFGVKQNILRELVRHGCDVTVLPAATPADDVLALHPDGVLLSNGPGDPKDVPEAVDTTRALLGRVPIFGICLGHQILALSLGADTYKLGYGHRGSNHPVKDLASGRITITTQNHGYAIRDESVADLPVTVTHRNLNDRTVEGLRHLELPAFSVQYHPEAGPGPQDSDQLFDAFLQQMRDFRNRHDQACGGGTNTERGADSGLGAGAPNTQPATI